MFGRVKTMWIGVFLLLLLVTIACTTVTAIRNPVENIQQDGGGEAAVKLRQAIIQNDPTTAKNILGNSKFKYEDSTFLGDHSYDGMRAIMENNAYGLLDLALTGTAHNGLYHASPNVCRTEIVRTLLDADLPPRPGDLANAAETPCPEIVDIILGKLSDYDAQPAVEFFIKDMRKKIRGGEVSPNIPEKAWDGVFTRLNDKSTPAQKARLAEMRQYLDQNIYKPVQKAADLKAEIESKFKMKFCSNPSLFNVIYTPFYGSIESGCIYQLRGPLKVLQALKGGVLLTLAQPSQYLPDKVIFVETRKPYVDDDPLGMLLVRSTGVTRYQTVLGVEKTVNAFRDLGEGQMATSSTQK